MSENERVTDLKSRLAQLKQDRLQFENRWKEAQLYVDSDVIQWGTLDTIPTIPKRYSSIPSNYLNTLVNGLLGYSISPNIVWFKLTLDDQKLLDDYGVKDFLEECERRLYAKFNSSNLYSQAYPWIKDAAVIGHGNLNMEWDNKRDKLRFTKLPANEVYLDINEYGEVDTVYRTYKMTLRNAVSFFGLENLNKNLQQDYRDIEKHNNKIEIIQAVYPREEYNEELQDAKNKPYACVFIDAENNSIIKESGYDEFPYSVFIWQKYPGYAYGTSPAQQAIIDIKGLNIIKKTSLNIAQTSANPPMKASEDLHNISMIPGGFTYVTSKDQVLEPVRTGENYPITLQELSDWKQDIKDWFNVDFFLMLQQKQAQMTATEVMELQGEKAATLSNLIVNLNNALLKIIQRSFNLLFANGQLPEVPPALAGSGSAIKVDFVGPLSQAQKKYHTMGGTAQALQSAAGIMQLFPNAGDYIDQDQLMKSTLEGQGMPQKVIREDDDVKRIRENRIKEQQAQAQAAQQQAFSQQLMQNANKLNEPVQEGSIIDSLNQQLTGGLQNG